jgi:hypothetical protein
MTTEFEDWMQTAVTTPIFSVLTGDWSSVGIEAAVWWLPDDCVLRTEDRPHQAFRSNDEMLLPKDHASRSERLPGAVQSASAVPGTLASNNDMQVLNPTSTENTLTAQIIIIGSLRTNFYTVVAHAFLRQNGVNDVSWFKLMPIQLALFATPFPGPAILHLDDVAWEHTAENRDLLCDAYLVITNQGLGRHSRHDFEGCLVGPKLRHAANLALPVAFMACLDFSRVAPTYPTPTLPSSWLKQ